MSPAYLCEADEKSLFLLPYLLMSSTFEGAALNGDKVFETRKVVESPFVRLAMMCPVDTRLGKSRLRGDAKVCSKPLPRAADDELFIVGFVLSKRAGNYF